MTEVEEYYKENFPQENGHEPWESLSDEHRKMISGLSHFAIWRLNKAGSHLVQTIGKEVKRGFTFKNKTK